MNIGKVTGGSGGKNLEWNQYGQSKNNDKHEKQKYTQSEETWEFRCSQDIDDRVRFWHL